ELERDARHRRLVGRLDDRYEIDVSERRPLRLHARAELLDLLVDLSNPLGVVLDGLNALGGQRREHYVGRHGALLRPKLMVGHRPAFQATVWFLADAPRGRSASRSRPPSHSAPSPRARPPSPTPAPRRPHRR